jgi:transposase
MEKNSKTTIGVDLGDRKSDICVLDESGEVIETAKVATTQVAMRAAFARERALVVIEVGTHSPWVSELLGELGHDVIVANPRQLALITKSHRKQDSRDAEMLARLGRADRKLLSPVKHRGTKARADLALVRVRDGLVATRTALINQARGMVKSFGYRLGGCSTRAFVKKTEQEVPEVLKEVMKPLFAALEVIIGQINECNRQLVLVARKYEDVEVLRRPDGVGLLTALTFLLTVEDKRRFQKSRDVGAYFGLVPRKHQSGGSDKQLRITKVGDAMVRRLLVSCAQRILGPFGKDSELRRFGLAMAERGGKLGKRRALVAVARKLAVLMHRLWVTGEEYQPLGYAKRAA